MRKSKILYFGLNPTHHPGQGLVTHQPLIEIKPLPHPPFHYEEVSHFLFTSQTAVELHPPFPQREIIALGRTTAKALEKRGLRVSHVAQEESQEGVIQLLQELCISYLHYPHSKLARPLIKEYLLQRGIPHFSCALYDTVTKVQPLLDLDAYDELVFTSSSTVQAFLELYQSAPSHLKMTAIGPVTQKAMEKIPLK